MTDRKSRRNYMLNNHKDICWKACCSECCGCETYEQGIKDFAKFLMDKNVVIDADMPDLVSEFLQEGQC